MQKKNIYHMLQSQMNWPLAGAIAVFIAFMILFHQVK